MSLTGLIEDITGESLSACAENDTECKKLEDEAAAKAALEEKQKEESKFKPGEYEPPVMEDTGLECSMDGFFDLSVKLVENALLLISLIKETFAYLLPAELNLTVQLLWGGFTGLGGWMGYAMAALYYVGTDYDFGLTVCEIFGYLYYVIDGMNYIVAFAKDSGLTGDCECPEDEPDCTCEGGIDLGGLVGGLAGDALGEAGLGDLADSVTGLVSDAVDAGVDAVADEAAA